jgi:hypothetical protein
MCSIDRKSSEEVSRCPSPASSGLGREAQAGPEGETSLAGEQAIYLDEAQCAVFAEQNPMLTIANARIGLSRHGDLRL